MNILLVGEESAGLQALQTIRRLNHRLVAVLASPSSRAFPSARVSDVAGRLGVPVWPARLVRDAGFGDALREEQIDIILNVHSLFIYCPEVLEAPRIGAFNLHPGPLPRYAGLNSPSWAIYRGEKSYGVTLHWMSSRIDAGPIAYHQLFEIEDTDTGLSLALKCVRAGIPLIEELLRVAASDPGAIPRIEQDLSKRQYFGSEVPDRGVLSWARPAREIVNLVRACNYQPFPSPWGRPRTRAGDVEVTIVSVNRTGRATDQPPGAIGRVKAGGVEIACADEWVLVREIVADGQNRSASEVLGATQRLEDP